MKRFNYAIFGIAIIVIVLCAFPVSASNLVENNYKPPTMIPTIKISTISSPSYLKTTNFFQPFYNSFQSQALASDRWMSSLKSSSDRTMSNFQSQALSSNRWMSSLKSSSDRTMSNFQSQALSSNRWMSSLQSPSYQAPRINSYSSYQAPRINSYSSYQAPRVSSYSSSGFRSY